MIRKKLSLFLILIKEGKFVIERVIARYQMLIGLFYIGFILFVGSQSLRPLLAFYIIRSAIIIFAFLFDKLRKGDRYYFAGFKEMSPPTYWRFVVMSMIVLRVPFLRYFSPSPFMSVLHIFMSTFIIGLLLMSFQNQYWAMNVKGGREKRINYLKQKIHLTEAEFEAIKPILINHAGKSHKMPVLWWGMIAIFSIVLGSTLSTSASNLVEFLLNLLNVTSSDLFPPYR